MKLKLKKPNITIVLYFISMLIGSLTALIFYDTSKAGLGIILAILIVSVYTKDIVSVLIFSLFIPFNTYFMYIPVVFTGGKTFNAFVNLAGFVGVLVIIILSLVKGGKIRATSYAKFMFLYCMAALVYYPFNSYVNKVSVIAMAWRLAPLMYCIILMHFIGQKEKYMDEFIVVLILSAVISVSVGFWELFQGSTFYYSLWTGEERFRHGILRMGSTQGDPNTLAEYIVPILFLLNTSKTRAIIGKVPARILTWIFFLMVFLTSSRMALLALLCGYGFYCLIYDKSWKKAAVVYVSVLGIAALPELFAFFNSQDMASSSMRLFLVGRALDNWRQNILFGMGSEQFWIKEYCMNMNEWMKQLSEFGLLGFLLYALFYAAVFIYYFRNKRKLNKTEKKNAALILSAVVAFGLNSLSLDTYYHYIMWMLPAMVMWFFVPHRETVDMRNGSSIKKEYELERKTI